MSIKGDTNDGAEQVLEPKVIAQRIRDKVADLNDDLILAHLAEVQVEFVVKNMPEDGAVDLLVWCSQEVR